ncbi:LacI family DNA-binding transcriptional regulator [Humibacter ginsenosidimutans]|uniref:LacI family transcriptional regulator n=1 Tax=Humibacter ginsenosidimutans TaxID=2599293 RepID=A0A5B8M881_9MICO|nr:LacI family DNA-binding transcriptional regulator [Humibacter ginsenosidimutans]QDZ15885.1 LacI family transcriptional regulator [Humibacter ginsenosidimutans]
MAKKPDGHASVTLKDVASRVGVTTAAASMALSGHERISEKTRDAVRKAADELGYVPSSAGRALRKQRAGAIAVVVPNTSQHVFGHLYFMHVLTGVASAANEHDSQLIVSTNPDEAHGVVAYERVMRSRTADGAIVTSSAIDDPNIEALVKTGLPVVLIGNFPYLPDAVSVGIDDVRATEAITEHLIDVHGVTAPVHVTGTLDHQTGVDRREGFLRAVRAHGLDETSHIIEGDLSEASGAAAVEQLLADGIRFDGIVFANDDMALGGSRVLRSRGIRVPDDVAIVGFDDFGLARVATPALTTVRVPAEQMSRFAAEQLFRLIDGSAQGPTHHELDVELVLRASCGCEHDDTEHVIPLRGEKPHGNDMQRSISQ